ncbi:hypothetical protein Xph01_51090 [Micromonospora phaseoli]|nr:hypothetical protein Xph01_51090 [Micromonospora phaseoli]
MPEYRTARRQVRGDRVGEARLAQPRQVGHGRLGAGQHDQVGGGQLGRLDGQPHSHPGLGGERLDIGGVADPGQPQHGHVEPLGAVRGGRTAEHPTVGERVLRVEPQVQRPGQHPVGGTAGHAAQHLQPGGEQAEIAPELVDHEAGEQRLVGGVEQGQGAEHGGEHTAPVDVADHDGG